MKTKITGSTNFTVLNWHEPSILESVARLCIIENVERVKYAFDQKSRKGLHLQSMVNVQKTDSMSYGNK